MADLDMQRVKNIHMVGVGGCGMSGIAKILCEMSFKVSGSDVREGPNTIRLKDLGVKINIGHDAANVREADLLIYSSAVTAENVELVEAGGKGIPIIKRAEMLAWIMDQSENRIAIAGTHGKTTTTAMISKVLDAGKFNPTYFIGCDMDYIEGNAKLGNGKYAVAEADESDSSFLYLSPTIEVITNIEDDHMERFGSMATLIETFEEFARRLADNGFILVDATNPNNQELMKKVGARFITYGLSGKAQYTADHLRFDQFTSRFTLLRSGEKIGEVELAVPGWQNVLNSLPVFAISFELGLDFNTIAGALRTFVGARRRFQTVGEERNILIIDDYAHHPTEVKATLSAARSGWPGRRIICVFQPHRYSRTLLLKDQFGLAFPDADIVYITDIYAASEKPIPGISGKSIADRINPTIVGKGKEVIYEPRKEKIVDCLMDAAKEGDLILTMGAGDIYTVGKELLSRLKIGK
ncbi:MAG: UDP-N-acetylmuramate--L-alanine ligase [Candidatus Margulisbacteria bacterium]|nr:UDP-N-acetylmuramate--L-alanine ligase [Candidatus Margulisiibacteriota bacterium]